MNKLYATIKAIRVKKGLTQEEVAEKLNTTQGNYTRIERGQTQLTVERLEELADIFQMSVSAILEYGSENAIDFKEDVEYYFKQNQKLEKKVEELKKQIEEFEETDSFFTERKNNEIESLKQRNKALQEKIKQKEEIILERDKTIQDKDKVISMFEKTIDILSKMENK